MKLDQMNQQFTVLSGRAVAELDAVLWQMEHQASGARLVWLERDEKNKTFGIAFQTQPWDDTGVFHILEHSVLGGSQRYPAKEPFVELLKSSMNTFLNAMTFPDKTFYPTSSRSDQDFINLLRVYMDAVLHPLLHSRPEIFRQEGWRYELDADGRPSYQGVVFNEMKGAFSAPDTLLERELSRRLFPDVCYRWVSGGDPEHIPELTYEQFTAAHSRLYHPSNAYIFLDGAVDIETVLNVLDREYLSGYARVPRPDPIPLQKPVDGGTAEIVYELSSQEGLEGRTWLAENCVACTYRDRDVLTALRALSDVLCGNNQAPLKRRLLEQGLAKDVRLEVHDGIQQPYVSLKALNIREDEADRVSEALREELERLVREGLDHERLLAALDNLEFRARQRDYDRIPQGIALGMEVLESWLYGGDPGANLSVGTLFDELRKKCGEGYFEELLARTLLGNPHRCRVIMRPSHTAGQERQRREDLRLSAAQAGWSGAAIGGIRRMQSRLRAWHDTPDTPEQLASIPRLRLDQVPAQPEELPLAEEEASGLPVLRHRLTTGGITYLNLYFALDDLTAEQLAQASLLTRLLGALDTQARGAEELRRETQSLWGQLQFTVETYGRRSAPLRCRTFLCVSGSVLDGKLERAAALLPEMLTKSRLDHAGQVCALLGQHKTELARQLVAGGHNTAVGRVLACSTAEGAVQEQTEGVAFLRWLTELERNFQSGFPALSERLSQLCGTVFSRSRLTVSVTGMKDDAAPIAAEVLAAELPEGGFVLPAQPLIRPWGRRREGIVVPADVAFTAAGGPFQAAARGAAKVVGRAVSLGCLWDAIRARGGAYGTGMVLRDTGFGGFYSFRDPNAPRTLDCYRAAADFLRGIGDMDLTGVMIGAAAGSDPLLTPRMRGKTADACHWRGVSYEDLRRTRREILSTAPEDVIGFADSVERLAVEGSVCVLGPQKQIDACGGRLDCVTAL